MLIRGFYKLITNCSYSVNTTASEVKGNNPHKDQKRGCCMQQVLAAGRESMAEL